jgi:23S rRNA pseudouridine1911/1915/1917 synthase
LEKTEYKFRVSASNSGNRLDKLVHSLLPQYTRSFLQHLIRSGNILLNGKKTKSGQKLKPEDKIHVHIKAVEHSTVIPEKMDLEIVYEDNDLLVVNKPSGLVVHPGAGHYTGTLVNGLLYHCHDLSGINGVLRPGIVHRLDKNTSGLMVIAKNNESHLKLARQFDTREIIRTYIALVWGKFENKSGQIKSRISRSQRDRKKMTVTSSGGREAITNYLVLKDYEYFSLLKLSLKTGRTHQIRVHLKHIHHPVFGDPDYSGRQAQLNRLPSFLKTPAMDLLKRISRQALHACKLAFIHPHSGKRISFKTDLPDDFKRLLCGLPLN